MRIGIDARMYGPEQGGLGRYVEQLLHQLLLLDTPVTWVVIVKTEKQAEKIRAEISGVQVEKVEFFLADIPWYSLAEQFKMPRILSLLNLDLVHFPHWNVPIFYNKPFVVTIHDLIMYHYPRPEATTLGPIKFWLKDKFARFVIKSAVKKAKHILVTSEFTKGDVAGTLGVDRNKMTVTYQAPTDNRKQITDNKLVFPKPYFLYVGSAYPHKNLAGLLKAWNIFQEKTAGKYQLVLVGKKSYFYDQLSTVIKRENVRDVVLAGFIPDEALPHVYKNAAVYVFPSLYEGFGLPPLEAMQWGVPVVSSNRSCLPEILGEAAYFADPTDAQAFADALYQVATNQDIRFTLKNQAKIELAHYSWEKLARETWAVYRQALKT